MKNIFRRYKERISAFLFKRLSELPTGILLTTIAIVPILIGDLTARKVTLIDHGAREPIVVRGAFDRLAAATPHSFEEYNKSRFVSIESDGCGNRFALLVHEPHSNPDRELALLELLENVARNNLDPGQSITLLLEGAYAPAEINDSLSRPYFRSGEHDIRDFIEVSEHHWSSDFYEPLQTASQSLSVSSFHWIVDDFVNGRASEVMQPAPLASQAHRTAFVNHARFNQITHEPIGAIDSQSAFLQRLKSLNHPNATSAADRWRQSIVPGNSAFARFAVSKLRLQAPYAFEIYAEGLTDSDEVLF